MLRVVSFVLTLLVISSLATKAHAKGKLILTIDRVYDHEIHEELPLQPTALVSIKNTTARHYKTIQVDCRWLKNGKAQAVEIGYIENLYPGQTGSVEVSRIVASHANQIKYDNVSCRITDMRCGLSLEQC